jgi:hypothetical protein
MSVTFLNYNELSSQHRLDYQRDGVVVASGLYTPEELSAAQTAVWQGLKVFPDHREQWAKYGGGLNMLPQFASATAEWNLQSHPNLLRTVELLTGWEPKYFDQCAGMLLANFHPDETDWLGMHLDFSGNGARIAHGEQLVYALIYLSDVDENCARTKVVPGSHLITRRHLQEQPDDPRNAELYDDVKFFNFPEPEPLLVKAGDVVLFDYLLAHSSSGHRSQNPRFICRTGFTNGVGDLAVCRAKIDDAARAALSPRARQLAGID